MRCAGNAAGSDCLCCVQPRFRCMWEQYCPGVQAIVNSRDGYTNADHLCDVQPRLRSMWEHYLSAKECRLVCMGCMLQMTPR